VRKLKKLPLEALEPACHPLRRYDEPVAAIDWQSMFGNANPVELEVGFGKGLFLVRSAQENPNVNYFGIEIVRKYQLIAATRIIQLGLKNVKVAADDAKPYLSQAIPEGSLQAVHVYFPDPWWKNRHQKKKLFTEDFARSVARVLKPNGVLYFVSDVKDYFDMVREILAEIPIFVEELPQEALPGTHDLDYLTHFERKFRIEGRPIYRSKYLRVEGEIPRVG
jgi:tRNA (guanine-N7-)-methyltransferase